MERKRVRKYEDKKRERIENRLFSEYLEAKRLLGSEKIEQQEDGQFPRFADIKALLHKRFCKHFPEVIVTLHKFTVIREQNGSEENFFLYERFTRTSPYIIQVTTADGTLNEFFVIYSSLSQIDVKFIKKYKKHQKNHSSATTPTILQSGTKLEVNLTPLDFHKSSGNLDDVIAKRLREITKSNSADTAVLARLTEEVREPEVTVTPESDDVTATVQKSTVLTELPIETLATNDIFEIPTRNQDHQLMLESPFAIRNKAMYINFLAKLKRTLRSNRCDVYIPKIVDVQFFNGSVVLSTITFTSKKEDKKVLAIIISDSAATNLPDFLNKLAEHLSQKEALPADVPTSNVGLSQYFLRHSIAVLIASPEKWIPEADILTLKTAFKNKP